MVSQKFRHLDGRGIPEANPHYFRCRTPEHAEAMEILILRHEDAAMRLRQFPYLFVGGAPEPEWADMQGLGKIVAEQRTKVFGKLLVEEQAHGSGRRNAAQPAFAFGGVGKTSANIFERQLRKFFQQSLLRSAAREMPQYIPHCNAGSPDARLAKPDCRIDADAIEQTHASSLSHSFASQRR